MSTIQESGQRIALDRIRVPDNVRSLDEAHVQALAGSIALQGVLVPLVVRPDGDGFELVAGFHRLAAARSLELAEVPVVVRDADTEEADRAVENIARKQLNPYEEAKAVRAMLDRGLTETGAAQALGWPKARVSARVKVLELPERAQQLIGDGTIALSAVDQLRAIGTVAPSCSRPWSPTWTTATRGRRSGSRASRAGCSTPRSPTPATTAVFAAHLQSASGHEIAELRLGKKTEQLYAECERLHRQLDRYAYGPPPVRFTEEDVDQARAAGVLIEFDSGRPIIVDRSLYRELVKAAIKRTHAELEAKAAAAAEQKKSQRTAGPPADPVAVAKRERDAQLRELADQAHGANLDLGTALISHLAAVDPADLTVARFFVYALLGADHDRSPYTQTGERIARLAAHGVRLVIEELRTDVTKTRKDGSRGRLRVRLRRPARPAGRDPLAVEVHRRRQDRRRALRPRAGRDRRRTARQPARRPRQPAHARHPLELAQGPRRQGAAQARRPAPARLADQARAGRQARPRRLRAGRDRRPPQGRPATPSAEPA